MVPFSTYICNKDEDFQRCMTYMLETKRTADPGLRTADAYAAMLRVLTYGTLLRLEDEQGQVIGIVGYTIGTPQRDYEDRDVAYVEYCLAAPSRHGTRFFLQGLTVLVQTIQEQHPEAVYLSLAAAENHRLNNRLYAKFAAPSGRDESLNLYTTTLENVSKYTTRFY